MSPSEYFWSTFSCLYLAPGLLVYEKEMVFLLGSTDLAKEEDLFGIQSPCPSHAAEARQGRFLKPFSSLLDQILP